MCTHYNASNSRQSPSLRALSATAILAAFLFCMPARAAKHKSAPPPQSAASYPANESHPSEHLTVAADPCDDPKQCSFFRLPYIQHGLLPVRVIFTNDGDLALQLSDARMQFISSTNDKVPAATEDEINRRFFTYKSTKPIHIPLDPFPVQRTPIDKKITQDDNDFGFQSTVVKPHSTLAGYLFYDITGLDDPPLKGAVLYIKMIYTLDGKQELFDFNIPFDKWLAANPNSPSNHQRK